MKRKEAKQTQDVVIYRPKQGKADFRVRIEEDTVWLSQKDLADLFETERSVITKHLRNIFFSAELKEDSVCAKIAHTAEDGKRYQVKFYNLDAIISVGYRVNSKQATQFRVWATSVLKKYLIDGYAVNERRLRQSQENFQSLQSTIQFLHSKLSAKTLKGQEKEIFSLLSDYSKTLSVLERYDKNALGEPKGKTARFVLKHTEATNVLTKVRENLVAKKEASELFASERGEVFAGVIGNLYQTFDRKELYRSVEEKAAHLLYFTIKDHPFSDGNKRSAAFLFVYFLDRNRHLYKKSGERKINDNALAALALLVAESDPKEKDIMIRLITNLIAE